MLFDEAGELVHECAPVCRGHVSPGGVVQGFSGSFDSEVDIFGTGCVDAADFFFVSGLR